MEDEEYGRRSGGHPGSDSESGENSDSDENPREHSEIDEESGESESVVRFSTQSHFLESGFVIFNPIY